MVAGHHQIEVAIFQLSRTRVDNQFTVRPADPNSPDRSLKGKVGNFQGRGSAHNCHRVRIDLGISGEHRRNNLKFFSVFFGK